MIVHITEKISILQGRISMVLHVGWSAGDARAVAVGVVGAALSE